MPRIGDKPSPELANRQFVLNVEQLAQKWGAKLTVIDPAKTGPTGGEQS